MTLTRDSLSQASIMLSKLEGITLWRRVAFVFLSALCLAALGSCGSGQKPEAAAAPLRIGGIYNLTGDLAPLGIPSTKGAQLAVEEINTAGGIRGRSLELIVRDGASNIRTVAEVARGLVADEQILALMGLSDTDMVLAAAPIAASAGRVFLTSGATSPLLVDQIPEYLFLACFTDNVQAAAAAEFSVRQLDLSTAYILADSGMDYSRLLGRYFGEAFDSFKGSVVKRGASSTAGVTSQLQLKHSVASIPHRHYSIWRLALTKPRGWLRRIARRTSRSLSSAVTASTRQPCMEAAGRPGRSISPPIPI